MWAKEEMGSLEGYLGFVPPYDQPWGGPAAASDDEERTQEITIWRALDAVIDEAVRPFEDAYKAMRAAMKVVFVKFGVIPGAS